MKLFQSLRYFLLAACIALSVQPVPARAAEQIMPLPSSPYASGTAAYSGSCGETLDWMLENGALLLRGEGTMTAYPSGDAVPWYAYRDSITMVFIDADVADICGSAFSECANLTDVFYGGNRNGWAAVQVGDNNLCLHNSVFHFEAAVYTITFDPNNGAESTVITVINGSPYGKLPVPVREGWNFDGWFTAPEDGKQINSYDTIALTEDKTLYAHWTERCPLGDINQDGIVDVFDAANALQYSIGLIQLDSTSQSLGDVNRDGTLDSSDAAMILRLDAGLIDHFPSSDSTET